MAKIRVLVAEDSLTTRKYLVDALRAHPDFEVVGEAEDGKRAIEMCRTLRPDVITLDMIMPGLSGLAVTEYLMAYCPTPILIVSASMNRGELYKTYEALAAGAVDVLDKPAGDAANREWERKFFFTVKVVSKIKVITHIRARLDPFAGQVQSAPAAGTRGSGSPKSIVAIGGSTGGPAAMVDLLRALPSGFQMPILGVIHIGGPLGIAFADWLDSQSSLSVRWARDGEPLPSFGQAGVVMAPPGQHLAVEGGRLWLTSAPERNSCRPSVDVLFESLAREHGPDTVACLLTGMGRDGARGLLALRHAGALTIAQDEASCVIFGMPREAIEIGAAHRVLPLGQIAPALAAVEGAFVRSKK
jgi:two-component system, chemotaxis family, protein-glutamate methylesterase/glutaminase